MTCSGCGAEVDEGAYLCPQCGLALRVATPQAAPALKHVADNGAFPSKPLTRKSPFLAMVFECLLPGGGLIYAGDVARGRRWFISTYAVSIGLSCVLPGIVGYPTALTGSTDSSAFSLMLSIVLGIGCLMWPILRIVTAVKAINTHNRRVDSQEDLMTRMRVGSIARFEQEVRR